MRVRIGIPYPAVLRHPAHRSRLDVHGLEAGMLALMHSLDEKVVYGCFKVGVLAVEAG